MDNWYESEHECKSSCKCRETTELIAVDVFCTEPHKGKTDIFICSNCYQSIKLPEIVETCYYKYCPYCGCRAISTFNQK